MPDTFLDNSLIEFNHQDALDAKVDTYTRLSPIMNMENKPAVTPDFAYNLSVLNQGPSETVNDGMKIDIHKAVISKDPVIKEHALAAVENELNKNPQYKYGLGRTIESPYDENVKKFETKEFGYSALRDNEDFYYKNVYMKDGWFMRNLIKNPARFVGRVVPQAVLKLGEGFGYVGAMLNPVNWDQDYWANVADNGMSRWLENAEQHVKDQWIPVYKQAGFDNKGFFSKLVDWSFWNDSVADAVAFMASAVIPGTGFAKLGKIGAIAGEVGEGIEAANAFGRAFSTTSKLGKVASKVGMGSWAELSSWTFNTAMEAAQEGSGVYKDTVKKLEKLRATGAKGYENITDEDIRQRAGKLASSTILENFGILAFSNMWENTLFFKSSKGVVGKIDGLGEDFVGRSSAIEGLKSKNPFASSLSRTRFYGEKGIEGFVMEGLWEENAQLAVQRINSIDENGGDNNKSFARRYFEQIRDAFSGVDQEAAESIGLGALIGVVAGGGFSKLSNERREEIKAINDIIDQTRIAKNRMLSTNNLYETDEDGKIKFDEKTNEPKVDNAKLAAKLQAINNNLGDMKLTTFEELKNSKPAQLISKRALSNYIYSLYNLGIEDVASHIQSINPHYASIFGFDNKTLKEEATEYTNFARNFESDIKRINSVEYSDPKGISQKDINTTKEAAKSLAYQNAADNRIFSKFTSEEQSKILQSLNKLRNLNNASLSEYPVDALNTLIFQKETNKKVIESKEFKEDMSDLEKKYHLDRQAELEKEIELFKNENEILLKDAETTPSGLMVAYRKDETNGNKFLLPHTSDNTKSLKKIAEYQNIIHKGSYIESLLTDRDNWYDNYQKLKSIPSLLKLEENIKKAGETYSKSVFAKYTQENPGDFARVVRLVSKIASGSELSEEELKLQERYKELVEELTPQYIEAVEKNKNKVVSEKLERTQKEANRIVENIFDKNAKRKALYEKVLDLTEELKRAISDNNTVTINSLQKTINSIQDDINTLQDSIDEDNKTLEKHDIQIRILEQEIESGNFLGFAGHLDEMKKEREWLKNDIEEKKGILKKLESLVKDLIKIAKQIFGKFNIKNLDKILNPEINKWAHQNRLNYDEEKISAYDEIKLKEEERDNLKNTIAELEGVYKELDKKVEAYRERLNNIVAQTNAQFDEQYRILTNTAKKGEYKDNNTDLTKSFEGEFTSPPSNNGTTSQDEGYDGADYIRPLITKFHTTTFQDARTTNFTKSELNYFEFLENLSNPEEYKKIKSKLGKNGKLKVIAVTRNNIEALKLKPILYKKTNADGTVDDQTKYWEDKEITTARIDFITVLSEGGKLYFVDKDLNKLGEVGKDTPAKDKFLSTILRSAKFTDAELEQYKVKYKEGQITKALESGKAFRKGIMEKSESFDIENPNNIYDFNITRGIANKFKNADGTNAKNTVGETILPESEITGQTIVITTDTGNGEFNLNNEVITLPKGRPFIKVKSFKEQLYAADNNKIEEPLANTIVKALEELATDYISTVETVMTKELGDRKLSDLSEEERNKVLLTFNKKEKQKKFNVSLVRYLQSVVYFGTLKNSEIDFNGQTYKVKEVPNKSKIYINGSKIHFGDFSVDLSNPQGFNDPKVKSFIMNLYHNVNYFTDVKIANKPYNEYYLDNNELKTREWKTYNHYLLSEKNPDGSKRSFIPITVAVKTKAQQKLENNDEPYLTAKSRSIIIHAPIDESLNKKIVTEQTELTPDQANSMTFTSLFGGKKTEVKTEEKEDELEGKSSIMKNLRRTQKERESKETPKEEKKSTAQGRDKFRDIANKFKEMREAGNPVEEKPETEVKPTTTSKKETDDFFDPNNTQTSSDESFDPLGGMFRISTSGFFKTEADLDEVIRYASKVLPQFPVHRLRNAIRTLDGREAFGEFIGNAIKLWEGAEEGTLYHEIFEGVANRLLSDYEWKAIESEFKSRKGNFVDRETGETVDYSKATSHQVKEQIAEEFRQFKLTGKMPVETKNTRTFFQVILDFIKKLFTNRTTIESIFRDIDEGKFADRKVASNNRFQSNYSVKRTPIPIKEYNDFLQGFTSLMFRDIFENPESLTNLDDLGEIDSVIYERIKAQINAMFDAYTDNVRSGKVYRIDNPNAKVNEENQQKREALMQAIKNWTAIKNDWGTFVRDHKVRLRPLSIRFDEDIDLSDETNDGKNRNDYTQNPFKVNAKHSATPTVKFLVGTLLKSKANGTVIASNQIFPNLIRQDSYSFLPQLENYDNMMISVLQKLSNLNDINKIEQKLKEVAKIKALEEAEESEQKDIANGMNEEETAMSLLYMRLFMPNNKVSEEARWAIKTKFLSYVSKQSPQPYIALMYDGNVTFVRSNERISYESFIKKMQNSIVHNITDAFYSEIYKGKKRWVSKIKEGVSFADFTSGRNVAGQQKIKEFINFLGLTDVITPEFVSSLNDEERNQLGNILTSMRNSMRDVKFEGDINLRALNIYGYTNKLIDLLIELNPQSENLMHYINGDNENQQLFVQPSFISKVVSEINNVSTLQELHEKFPQTATEFSQDSIIIKQLFNEDGTRNENKVSLGYMEGLKDNETQAFKKMSKMEVHERLGMNFFMTLNGMYSSLPADSETEWIFNFGHFVNFSEKFLSSNNNKIINELFIPKLHSEIEIVRNSAKYNHILQLNQTHDEIGEKVGESLRFFKDILQYTGRKKKGLDLVNKIHQEIKSGKSAERIIIDNKTAIKNTINNYLNDRTQKTLDNLVENRIIVSDGENYMIPKLGEKLAKEFGGEIFTEDQIKDIIAYSVVNSNVAYMEQFKLLFGDVAQYKDWEKRAKSLFSPVEQMFFDETGEFNNWLNKNKNAVQLNENESVNIPENDMFYTGFKNYWNSRTINDFEVVSPEVVNTLNRLDAPFRNKYEETNETDGQSIGNLQAGRELMIKSGWRWTKANEDFFQYDSALARKELSEAGVYKYSSEELKKADLYTIDKFKDNIPTEGINPVKTLCPSVRPDGTMDLLKHSIYFMSYQLAKSYPDMLHMYIDMLKKGDDIRNFKSVQKVGLTIDDKGKITSHYKNPWEPNDLEKEGNEQFQVSFKTMGIQVETQGSKKGQTLGSQLTKDIALNLMPDGIPSDYSLENSHLSKEQNLNNWLNLPENEKMQYKNYRLVRNVISKLENLKDKSAIDTFTRLGVSYKVDDDGKISYKANDLKKLQSFIVDELTRLEIDSNTLSALKLTEEMDKFLNPSETLPTYDTVANVIWSIADTAISSMKVNGKPYIQVSSAFFNKGSRKAAYKDKDGNWVTVNTKEEFEKLQKEDKKLVMTSSELSFYSIKEGDQEISGMEILLPNIYKKKVNAKREKLGLPKLSDEELMEWLNKNPKLLEGIGFRIPTQATSSLEFFRIKGFLPESFGSSIVVPSDITTKAGSDFDVDKLNTYLNNWKLNKEGLPEYEKINEDSEERFIAYVRSKTEDYNEIFKDMFASEEALSNKARLDEAYGKVGEVSKELDLIKDQFENEYTRGLDLFYHLPLSIKQQYWEKEKQLAQLDSDFFVKFATYHAFTTQFINELGSGQPVVLPVRLRKRDKKTNSFYYEDTTETVYPEEVTPIMNDMLDNYIEVIRKARIKDETFKKIIERIGSARDLKSKLTKSFKVEVANVIAEETGLLNIVDFENLPLHLQTTRGAVENEYFDAIRDILKQPERYLQLLSINSMDNIKDMKKTVLNAKGDESVKSKEINYSNFLDSNFIVSKRQAFVRGKSDIGIFAVAMTNFANSQVVGLGIANTIVKQKDQWVMYLNKDDIRLPFSEIQYMNVNGELFMPLSGEKTSDGSYIMDNISGYINGAVDVAKEPDIIEMGMHTEFAGAYMVLERLGVSKSKIALFMYQPAIREFLKELIFFRNKQFGYSSFGSQKEIRTYLLDKYKSNKPFDASRIVSEEEMKAMIKKGEQIKNGEKVNWTPSELELQNYLLRNFFKVRMYGQNLFEHVQGSNHDTSKVRSSYSILRKDLIYEGSYEGNNVVSPTKDGFVNGTKALREGTFVQKTIDLLKTFNTVFADTNLFVLQHSNPKTKLGKIAKNLYNQRGGYLSADEFDKIMKEYEVSMIDSLLNNHVYTGSGVKLNDLSRQLFQQKQTLEDGRVVNANNLFEQFGTLKRKFPVYFKQNYFLSNLDIDFDPKTGIYSLSLKRNFGRGDILSRDLLIDGWRELHNTSSEELNKFANALEIGTLIQYGVKFQRTSLLPYMPVEYYSQYSTKAMESIDTEPFITFEEEVLRENTYKKGFVHETIPIAMEFVLPNGNTTTVWSERTAEQKKYKMKPKTSQRRFILDGDINKPVFLWQKYMGLEDAGDENFKALLARAPQFTAVKMVKPEYIVKNYDERGDLYTSLSKEAYEMIKRKDFSWLYTQLYKMVGLDNGNALVKKSGKKDKVSLYIMYKPINSVGFTNFNEKAQLSIDDSGNVTGKPSVLRPHLPVKEMKDEDIFNIVNQSATKNINFASMRSIMEIEDGSPEVEITGSETRDLGLKNSMKDKINKKPGDCK